MPGIPWTSKGCNTCRRRKVGCDQKRPSCDRCTRTGRVCEGYDRQSKSRFRSQRKSDAGSPSSANTSSNNTSPASSSQETGVIALINHSPIAFPAELTATDITDYQLVNTFLDIYYPKFTDARAHPHHGWLIDAAQFAEPGNALRLALRAVSMDRIGYYTSNEDLILHGQTNYTGALSEFQKALWDPAESREDRTLAAARALTLYELFASKSFKGWNMHSKGFASLLQMRGPETLQSTFSRKLIESFRATSMFQSIQFRESSFLTTPEWQAHTYDPANTTAHLYDTGLELAGFLGDIDRLAESTAPYVNVGWQTLLTRCIEFDRRLDGIYGRYVSDQKQLPIYWETSAGQGFNSLGDTDHMASLSPIEFHDVIIAHTVADYWALKSIVCSTLGSICQRVSMPQASLEAEEGKSCASYVIVSQLPDKDMCQDVADRISHHLATKIVKVVPYCERDEQGMIGPQRLLFSLRMALFTLRALQAEELPEAEKRFAELTTKKGVGYATAIGHIPDSQWDKIENNRTPRKFSLSGSQGGV